MPVEGGSIDSLLTAAAERHADRRALSSTVGSVTYAELDAAVDELARRLGELAGTGERVAVIGPNVPALVAGMFAAWRAGAVAVPLSARLREYELTGILGDAEPAAVVTVSSYRGYSFVDLLERLRPELTGFRGALVVDELGEVVDGVGGEPESHEGEAVAPGTAALLYTSGTTGRPKGALVAHARELGVASELAGVLALTPDDACAQVLPVAHAFGLNCLVAAFAAGANVVLGDSAATIRPLVAAVSEHEASVLHGSPALFLSLLKAVPDGLPSVRRGFVGGAASPPGLIERLEGVGMTALNLYGMTEIAAAACCRPDDPPEVRYTSAGRPMRGFEWRVEPSDAAVEGTGELLVRGPWVTSGYFRRPEETEAAFVDGWFRTGDIGGFDDGGHLTISGRIKEVVQVAGFSVFPAEIEGFLLTHPDVAQAAVVGAPHAQMGEVLQAFVVPREAADVTPTALLQYARGKIADYKLPYGIRVVDELPLLASGKPDRIALSARVAEEATAASTA